MKYHLKLLWLQSLAHHCFHEWAGALPPAKEPCRHSLYDWTVVLWPKGMCWPRWAGMLLPRHHPQQAQRMPGSPLALGRLEPKRSSTPPFVGIFCTLKTSPLLTHLSQTTIHQRRKEIRPRVLTNSSALELEWYYFCFPSIFIVWAFLLIFCKYSSSQSLWNCNGF